MADDTEQQTVEDSPQCVKIVVSLEVKAEIEAIRRIVNGVNRRLEKLDEMIATSG